MAETNGTVALESIPSDSLLTYQDVATRLGVSKNTVRIWVREGKLDEIKLGHRTVRVPAGSLKAFINSGRVRRNRHD
jgi:excisionase family DNA binding protein